MHPTIWRGHYCSLASASFFRFVWDAKFGSVGTMTRVQRRVDPSNRYACHVTVFGYLNISCINISLERGRKIFDVDFFFNSADLSHDNQLNQSTSLKKFKKKRHTDEIFPRLSLFFGRTIKVLALGIPCAYLTWMIQMAFQAPQATEY